MKGIILHAGHGTRLRPLTHTGPKQLLPIANKPMSQYSMEDLRQAGISEIALIVSPDHEEKVKNYYGDGKKFNVDLTYIKQESPKGIAHAIKLCKEFVGDEKFVVYLGDNILKEDLTQYVKKFKNSESSAMIFLTNVKNPSRFGIANVKNNKIEKIVEKPKNPTSNLAVIGVYFLTPEIFEIIENLKPSWRGEYEITDSLQLLLENNKEIEYQLVDGWWKDTGTPSDILHANQLLLETRVQKLTNSFDKKIGNIIIGKNSIITRDSIITGPVIIGEDTTIGHGTRIGPYVSIGNNCIIEKCEISNSIIMDRCKINKEIKIKDSIIAYDSYILDEDLEYTQFLLGEGSKIKS